MLAGSAQAVQPIPIPAWFTNQRTLLICLSVCALSSCSAGHKPSTNVYVGPGPFFDEAQPGADIVKVTPRPDKGFHWPYYLLVPENVPKDKPCRLLVLPNNSGYNTDDHRYQDNQAYNFLRSYAEAAYPRELPIPVLEPVFPRFRDERYVDVYFHDLDRDTLTVRGDPAIERVDLQLVAMIRDASARLAGRGIVVKPKVLMKGFSASGGFVSRFPALHPDMVEAAVAGSPGGLPFLPVGSWKGRSLRYPIGTGDFEALTGKKFSLEEFNAVKYFYHLGDQDVDNDPVYYRDAYDKEDEDLIVELFGKTRPDRWPVAEEIYRSVGNGSIFRLYPGIGHRTGGKGNLEILDFLKKNL